MASKDFADGRDSRKCPVCKDDIQEPWCLPCGHELCAQCLTQHVSASASADRTFPCPTCGTKCEVPVTDEGVTEAASSEPSGDSAPLCVKKEHGSATVFCCDCDKFFCRKCISQHQGCDWMSDHKQMSVDEMSFYDIKYAQSSRMTCPEHNLSLTILCKTCKKVICHTCLLYKHEDHQHQELLQSTIEAKKGMNNMTVEAKKVVNKQNDGLKETGQTKETIRKDVKNAKDSVKKSAQQICDAVRKHEKNLLDDLDRYEEEAIENLQHIEDNIKARKADAISLQKEISSLLQFGKPIEQVERTPVLQEKFDDQQKTEAEKMSWKYVFRGKNLSEEPVKSMLGDVKLATLTLGQPLQQVPLECTGNHVVTGMVVVGDGLCVVHAMDPHIWLYDIIKSQNKTCEIPHLKDPSGMALVNPTDQIVVITDENTEGGQLHYVKITDSLNISHLSSVDIALKQPRHVSVSLDNSELLIGQWDEPQFLVCDLQGNAKREVTVTSPDDTERFPYCVQQTTSGFAAVMWDKDYNSIIQWLGEDGTCTQSYGPKYDINRGQHMVLDQPGQVMVTDHRNDRLHFVDSNGCHIQFLLTENDGIVGPQCLYLNEAAGRLYVAHGSTGSLEVRVYNWPPTLGEYHLSLTVF